MIIDFSNVSITSDFGDYSKFPDLQQARIDKLEELREFYLTDLRMMGTGLLYEDSGDFITVGGLSNLAQSLTHRLMTDRGTNPMDITFGIPWSSYLGVSYSDRDLVRYELMQEVVNELYKDTRVQEITSIDVSFLDNNTLSVNVSVSPTGLGDVFSVALDVMGTGG